MGYERPNIAAMSGYTPGEQPTGDRLIKLNTNENPYPPCDAVMAVLRDFPAQRLRRYPSPAAAAFRRVAAAMHTLTPEHIVPTNGGDELLRLVITTFVEPGRPIAMAEPSYSLYPVLAQIHDSTMVRIDLADDWSLPTDLAARVLDAGAKLLFIVNPHAPSGTLTDVAALAELAARLQKSAVLVVDEAYVDFVDPSLRYDATALVRRFDNVVLLRTLSKGYSLAGLRFGYGLAAPSLIEPMLTKTRDSYNTDAIAQAVAEAALTHRDAAASTWQAVRSERARLTAALRQRGFTVPPSQSNFILATPPSVAPTAPQAASSHREGADHRSPRQAAGGTPGPPLARRLFESLKARQVYVRYFDQDRLRDKLRITVGTPAENDALLAALDAALKPHAKAADL